MCSPDPRLLNQQDAVGLNKVLGTRGNWSKNWIYQFFSGQYERAGGKMKSLRALIMFFCAIVFWLALQAVSLTYAANCGDELWEEETWKGEVGYHNGPYHAGKDPDPSDDQWTCNMTPGPFGHEWQCVEYVNRFYWAAGMNGKTWNGHASTYFDQAEQFGLTAYENEDAVPPKANDILCFDNGIHGHVAIVTGVVPIYENTYQVNIVEQNWSETGNFSLTMTYDPVNETYTIPPRDIYYAIEGWLRIPYSCRFYAQDPAEPITVYPGEVRTFSVYYTNTMAPPATSKLRTFGALDWKDDSEAGDNLTTEDLTNYGPSSPYFHYMELHSCDSAGNPAASWLYPGDGIWVSDDRIRVVPQNSFNVGYNENARFVFTGKVPDDAQTGTYDIYFRPYHSTGGYLEDWGNMHFTLTVNDTPPEYAVGQGAPAELVSTFLDKYVGNEGVLGNPISEVAGATSGFGTSGYYQRFENGSIQVHSGSAFVVVGDIYAEWGEQGYATWAGFPTSDRYSMFMSFFQDFEGGYIDSYGEGAEFVSTTHPEDLTAQVQEDNSVLLTWENRISANGVKVYRRGSPTEAIAVLGPDDTGYVDHDREPGHACTYFVQAFNETAESPPSNEAVVNSGLDNGPWPMFHHDVRHIGQSAYTNKLHSLKWRYKTGHHIYSSPAIGSDGTIYIGCDNHCLYAINPDGGLKWVYVTGWRILSSPAIGSDGTIYVGSSDYYLYAINPDGSLKWRYETGSHVCSSPAIGSDGTIYVGSCDDYYLYAINPDGSLKWRYETGSCICSSPAIGSDGTIYVGSLYAINPNGTLKWRYEAGSCIFSSPAIGSDGTIYVGSSDYYLYAINPDGSLKWRYETGSDVYSSPAIGSDGTIYVGSYDDYLYAVNPDGSLKWRYETGSDVHSSPAIGSDGTIYVGSYNDYLYAIGLPQDKGGIYGKVTDFGTGDPIAGATISTMVGDTQSGTDGTYAIALDPGVYDIICSKTGYQTITIPNVEIRTGESTELNVALPISLSGTVRDLSTGNPIPNVIVSTMYGQSTQTNQEGYYALGSLSPGVYDIIFRKTGYQTITIENVVVQANEYTELDIYLTTPGPLNIVTTELPSATTGKPYNSRVVITGGVYPYEFSLEYGLLPFGLSLNLATGNINGTPTAEGSYTFGIGVTDSEYSYAEREFTIEVTEPLIIHNDSECPRGTRGQSYFLSLDVTGGTWPYTFTRTAGSLPPGLSLDYHDGYISGTPTSTGIYSFTVKVRDDSGRTTSKDFILEIVNSLSITTSRLNDGITGQAFNQQLSASGGYGSYFWSVYAGNLPPGLSLNSVTGQITGTPSMATSGTVVFSVRDQDGREYFKDFNFLVVDPLGFVTTSLPTGHRDSPYSELVRIRGGAGPYSYSYQGQLPAGLSLDPDTGIVSGTPTLAGYTNVTINVSDSTWPTSQAISQTIGIRITSLLTIITSAVLPESRVGDALSPIVLQAAGGPSPYTWEIVSGSPPSGVILDRDTGTISGTPLDSGDYLFTVLVTDANAQTAEKEFILHVAQDLVMKTNVIPDGAKDRPYNFIIEAEGGKPYYQWRIKSGTLPYGLSLNQNTGTIYGTPTTRQSFQFTVEVNDSDSPAQVAEKTFSIEIYDQLFIDTVSLPNGRIDDAYISTITASLGVKPYTFSIYEGVLPPGLTMTATSESATISGTPTTVGDYTFTIEVMDNGTPVATAYRTYTIRVYGNIFIDTTGLRSALRGQPYSDSIQVFGGQLPYHWQIVEGSLPAGLSLNSGSGAITGITYLVEGQSSTFTVRVTDGGNPYSFDEKEFVIYVTSGLTITTGSIQNAMQDSFYSTTFEAQGGISPYHWSISDGDVPQGLELNEDTGVLSGTPTECGSFNFTVKVTDSFPVPETDTKAFSITAMGAGVIPGDANGDGSTNVQDVICVINVILDTGTAPGSPDCNDDGNVNVLDVICVINKILGG